jgi:uncharacterized protein YoxC
MGKLKTTLSILTVILMFLFLAFYLSQNSKLKALEAEHSALSVTASDLTAKVGALGQEKADLTTEAKKIADELKQSQDQLDRTQRSLDSANTNVTRLENNVQELRGSLSAQADQIKKATLYTAAYNDLVYRTVMSGLKIISLSHEAQSLRELVDLFPDSPKEDPLAQDSLGPSQADSANQPAVRESEPREPENRPRDLSEPSSSQKGVKPGTLYREPRILVL